MLPELSGREPMRMDMDFVRAAFRRSAAPTDAACASERPSLAVGAEEPTSGEPTGQRHAAVAAVLKEGQSGPDLLLIRRAQQDGDPWSGHMALPGGHRELTDRDLVDTATRETHEEVGLNLRAHGRLLGRLDGVQAIVKGHRLDLVIVPLVFSLTGPHATKPNPVEVEEVVWVPLMHLMSPAARCFHSYQADRKRFQLPAFDVDGRVVWGLTYRIVENLLTILKQQDPGEQDPGARGSVKGGAP